MKIAQRTLEDGVRWVLNGTKGKQVVWAQVLDGTVDVRKIITNAEAFEPPRFKADEATGEERTLEQLATEIADHQFSGQYFFDDNAVVAHIGTWPDGMAALVITAPPERTLL